MPELETTNVLLGVMAAVSVLQALVLIGAGIVGFRLYRKVTATLEELDEKRVRPLTARVDSILTQVHQLGERINRRAERIDTAIDETAAKVDQTATRVRSSVGDTVHRVAEVVTGLRGAIVNVLTTERETHETQGNGHAAAAPYPYPGMPPAGGMADTQERVREGGF